MKVKDGYNWKTHDYDYRDATLKEWLSDWWEDATDWIKWPVYILLVVFLATLLAGLSTALIMIMIYPLSVQYCNVSAQSFQHYYDFWGGCMVQYQDVWVPLKNVILNSK